MEKFEKGDLLVGKKSCIGVYSKTTYGVVVMCSYAENPSCICVLWCDPQTNEIREFTVEPSYFEKYHHFPLVK